MRKCGQEQVAKGLAVLDPLRDVVPCRTEGGAAVMAAVDGMMVGAARDHALGAWHPACRDPA